MMGGVVAFDLDRAMFDPEAVVEHDARAFEQGVGVIGARRHDMRGQRRLGRAQRPDVEIVHRVHPVELGQRNFHLVDVDAARNAGKRHPHRFLQQADAAP